MNNNWDSKMESLGKQVKTSYSIEMDEIARRKLIQYLHHLEKEFIYLLPKCDKIMESIYIVGKEFLCTDKNAGLAKIATYPSCSGRKCLDVDEVESGLETYQEEATKKEHTQKTRAQLEDFISGYEYVKSEKDEKKKKALQINLDYTFREINWSQKIRTVFSSKLSICLNNWDMLRKKLNRLIKENSTNTRINKFEYLSFLDNIDTYPLEQKTKDKIISQVQRHIDIINETLGVSMLDDFNVISEIMLNFNNYTIGKKAVLLSIKRYIASVCRKSGIDDAIETEEIINSATVEISSVLYRYRTEQPFIPYIHTWCHAAITKHRVNRKVMRAPLQIEQKRGLIYQAYNDVTKNNNNKQINFSLVADRLKELDSNSTIDAATIQLYVRTEDVSGFVSGDENNCYSDSIESQNGLYGANDFSESPEDTAYKQNQKTRILKAIKRLDKVDQTIIKLKIEGSAHASTIADIAEITNLSYDQCRRRIEKCNEELLKYCD